MYEGGHWGPRIKLGYLTTRNLAINGRTIRQVRSQVKRAAIYQPRWIVVAAGTNDAMLIAQGRHTLENAVSDLRELISGARFPVLLILPPPTRHPEYNEVLAKLCEQAVRAADEMGVQRINLWDQFTDRAGLLKEELTTDGIHLTDKAYQLWAAELRNYIRRPSSTRLLPLSFSTPAEN